MLTVTVRASAPFSAGFSVQEKSSGNTHSASIQDRKNAGALVWESFMRILYICAEKKPSPLLVPAAGLCYHAVV